MPKPQNEYNPIPSVDPSGGGGNQLSMRATPEDFGSEIAQAEQKLGAVGQKVGEEGIDLATKFAQEASEAKANDLIANSWSPVATQLRADFDSKRGQDKIQGYNDYVSGLQKAKADLILNAKTDYEKEILQNYSDKHINSEIGSARREQVASIQQFSDQAHAQKIMTDAGYMTNNYNNPQVVDEGFKMIDGQIEKHGLDKGETPEQIDQTKKTVRGAVATGMVERAIKSKDLPTATVIYHDNRNLIPGDYRLQIESTLHTEEVNQYSSAVVSSLKNGNPIPPMGGPKVQEVKIATVSVANSSGVDPNHALTVARMESNYGQNVGKRGDIGQTGKGGNLEEQVQNMVSHLKEAAPVAEKALGRPPEPWEQYAVYQQGVGGGPALFKASKENPTARAVDVLAPLYKTRAEALSAVTSNGGNATMTSGQFLSFIKENYNSNAARAAVDKTDPAAFKKPTEEINIAVQPSTSPAKELRNFDEVYPEMIRRANEIPNLEERKGVLAALKEQRNSVEIAAQAYNRNLVSDATRMMADPSFTSMSQVSPEQYNALIEANPQTISAMERRAEYNMKNLHNLVTQDKTELGSGFYKYFADPKVTDVSQIMGAAGKDGDLTPAGFDKMNQLLSKSNTPEGKSEMQMLRDYISRAKPMITGSNKEAGYKDRKGDKLFEEFMALTFSDYERGRGEGATPAQLLSQKGNKYMGSTIDGFVRPMSERLKDITEGDVSEGRTVADIFKDIQNGVITKEQGKAEAIELGFFPEESNKPQIPMAN